MTSALARNGLQSLRTRCGLVLVFGAAFVAPAIGAAAPAAAAVTITKFTFEPKEITVAPGTRIVWTNRDDTPHSVNSTDKSFASKGLDTGDTYDHTFASEGNFSYACSLHPFMTGIIHVRK
jgi:plastocyanin